ncbi:MAG: hypothetical protein H0X30_37630 [Anaerolineae bacterium]|nr:hypothetical protein [Anaerolineae bacterium]
MNNLSRQQIKRDELREWLGMGSFGAVLKAQQSTINREAAVKIILPHFSDYPNFIRSFETKLNGLHASNTRISCISIVKARWTKLKV